LGPVCWLLYPLSLLHHPLPVYQPLGPRPQTANHFLSLATDNFSSYVSFKRSTIRLFLWSGKRLLPPLKHHYYHHLHNLLQH